jgi:hypothetical protein
MDLKALIAKMDRIESRQNLMEAGDPAAYAKAQELMARLEKAAKYSGTDEIVRGRMGLPPPLPPIEQWDGTMPKPTGKPDWFSRLTTGGQATTDQAAAAGVNQGDASSFKFKQEKLKQLNDLVAKLGGPTGSVTVSGAPTAEGVRINSAIARSLTESFGYQLKEAADPAVIKQIQAIMAELNDMQDDPEIAKALQSAKAALDKASAEAKLPSGMTQAQVDQAKNATEPDAVVATPGSKPTGSAANGVNAQGQNVTMPDGTNPETGEKTTTTAGAAPATPGATAAAPAAGGDVKKVQDQLIALGVDVGKTGADGKMGPATIAGIKAFEKMAGKPETGKITPEFLQLLSKGAQIKSQSDLVASLGAMEQILTKYKVESVTHINDLDIMTESELRSYVMRNIKVLSEAEQMEFMKMVLTEAPERIDPTWSNSGAMVPAKPAGGGGMPYTPFRDVPAKPSMGSRIGQFAKNIASKVTGKVAAGVAGVAAIGAGAYGAYQGLKKLFADPNIQMDPADKAQFEKHMAVIDKYAKDAEAAGALPADVQKRLTAVAQRVQKIAGKVQAAPAAPGAPAAPVAPK